MHGRLKVRSTAEQEELKRIEREKKLKYYKKVMIECLKKLETNDFNEDGLKMSEEILCVNPDVMSLWNLRRKILLNKQSSSTTTIELEATYKNELTLSELSLRKNPKSYGSWLHRQWCLMRINNNLNLQESVINSYWQNELNLCNKYLDLDERNFHCWAYRKFVVKYAQNIISKLDEFKYTYDKISSNFSNYSSWHYRSKLIEDLYVNNKEIKIDEMFFENELSLIENAIFTDPNDQSAWVYHKWLFNEYLHNNTLKLIKLDKNLNKIELKFQVKKPLNFNNDLISIKLNNINLTKLVDWTNDCNYYWFGIITNSYNEEDSFSKLKEEKHDHIKIELNFKGIDTLNFILNKKFNNNDENYTYEYESNFLFNLNESVLNKHLNNLIELSGLESNKNKWCLLTIVYLMSFIDYNKYKQDIENNLNLLLNQVDIDRKQYYLDLKQKLLFQNN